MNRHRALVVTLSLLAFVSTAVPARSAEGPRPKKTSYNVVSRAGGVVRVAALEWEPRGARTVLLAVHGSGGVKENNWGPLSVPGYSFALHRYEEGRATVAIDLPAYGESEGDPDLVGMEDYAFVIAQIARELRSRFDHIVGVGHSVGGGLVDITQGVFASFDAIIPAAWSHGGFSAEYKATCGQRQCPDIRKMVFTSKANPRVVEDFVRPVEPISDAFALNIALYSGLFFGPDLGPAGDQVTATVTVPVLIILGKEDFFWAKSTLAEEPSHFPSSSDVSLLLLPDTGHAVFHHLNHNHVNSVIGRWLSNRYL